jgi:hypothetical protein
MTAAGDTSEIADYSTVVDNEFFEVK